MINLDYLCTKIGQEIGENSNEAPLRKALGILQEDGVYAMFLWLEKEDNNVRKKLNDLLNKEEIKNISCKMKVFLKTLKSFVKDSAKLVKISINCFSLKRYLSVH